MTFRHCKFAQQPNGDFMNDKNNIEKNVDLTTEETQILTDLTKEARERLETWKKSPNPQKYTAFTTTVCQIQAFLSQLLALRGIKTSPYKTA